MVARCHVVEDDWMGPQRMWPQKWIGGSKVQSSNGEWHEVVHRRPRRAFMTLVQMKVLELPLGVEWTGKRVTVVHPVVGAENRGDTVPVRAAGTTHSAHTVAADGSGSGPLGGERSRKPNTEEDK